MKTLGYYNGKYDEIDNMYIPMNDRVCWFGDGVYDAQTSRNGILFALEEHVDRFFNSAGLLDIKMPLTKDELKKLLNEMVGKMDDNELFVYYQVTRGTAPRDHAFPDCPANLWIMIRPKVIGDCKKPIKLISMEDTRFFHCNIKTLNLIPACVANQRAKEAGCEETVLYRPGERVTEGSHSNISIIQNGKFVTAPTDNLILPGIARAHLIKACKKLGIPVAEVPYTMTELRNAEEVIISSSTRPLLRAIELDGKPVGGKNPEIWEALRSEIIREYLDETTPK